MSTVTKPTTEDCLNREDSGLNTIAQQKFDVLYEDLSPRLQGYVREEAVRQAAHYLLASMHECQSLIEFYAEREMTAPANNQEAVRDTRDKLQRYRDAIALAEGK